jgi:hypothetical protein
LDTLIDFANASREGITKGAEQLSSRSAKLDKLSTEIEATISDVKQVTFAVTAQLHHR